MTVQEAIKNCKIFTKIYDLFKEDKLSIDTLIEFAEEALEKADKYGWHNLRKNPTDLPRENRMYWVCVEGFDTKYTSTYWDGYVWWGYSVIGWKEIESFEEVEE